MLTGPHAARAAHTTLDFVNDQKNPVALGQLAKFRKEIRRRDNVATFPLDRLNYHCRNLFGGNRRLEESLFSLDAGAIAIAGSVPVRAAIRIGVRNVLTPGSSGPNPFRCTALLAVNESDP